MPDDTNNCPSCNDHPMGKALPGSTADVLVREYVPPTAAELDFSHNFYAAMEARTSRSPFTEGIPVQTQDAGSPVEPLEPIAFQHQVSGADLLMPSQYTAPWFEPRGGPFIDTLGRALTTAQFPNKQFPKEAKEHIKKRHPGIQDEDIKGDDDGAFLARHTKDAKDQDYERRKSRGDDNPRRRCGGEVVYYIVLDELVLDDDPMQRRRIWDWAYLLKEKEAKELLKDCKSDSCTENKSSTECRIKLEGELSNWPPTIKPGDVPKFGYVRVAYLCSCLEPLPKKKAEGPTTGPGEGKAEKKDVPEAEDEK